MFCAFFNGKIAGAVEGDEITTEGGAQDFRIGDNRIADAKGFVVFCF